MTLADPGARAVAQSAALRRPLRGGLPALAVSLASALVLALALALTLAFAFAGASSAWAAASDADDLRLKALAEELRCMVCQNQTLADSNAELAVDLRNQVKAMIAQGQTDPQIKRYLVERYGDFVLYKPPVQANTWVLWVGPFALLGLGGLVWWQVGRRSRTLAPAPVAPTDADRRLLDD